MTNEIMKPTCARRDFLKLAGLGVAGVALFPRVGATTESGMSPGDSVPVKPASVPSYLKGYETLYAKDPHAAALQWFREARFGMMVSYSLCSLDGLNCFEQWQQKIPVREYEKKAERFTASGFDANAIAALAQSAGMKYVTMIVKFCEGFSFWNTRQTTFNSLNAAAKRDLVREMAEACRRRGLGFFLFYEHGFEWHHPHGPRFKDWKVRLAEVPYPTPDPAYAYGEQYDFNKYVDFISAQLTELLTDYGPVAGVWLDGWAVPKSGKTEKFRLPELYAQIRQLQPQALIAYKWGITGTEDFVAPEVSWISSEEKQIGDVVNRKESNTRLEQAQRAGKPVEVCDTLRPKWFFDKVLEPRSADYALKHLAFARSIGANYLLNIALMPDGSINSKEAAALRDVGEEVRRNKLLN